MVLLPPLGPLECADAIRGVQVLRRCARSVVGVVVLLTTVVGTVDAALTAPPALAQEATDPAWLARINEVRVGNGLPAAVVEPVWTAGIEAHLRYLLLSPPALRTGQYANAHSENPDSPYFTLEGEAAGKASNLGTASNDIAAIDGWLAAPFHAIGMIRPGLRRVGFARTESGGAGLDVIRGFDPSVEPTSPVFFPAPEGTTTLHTFQGESPNPLEPCGYERGGLPLIALLPEAPLAGITAELIHPDGTTASGPGAQLCVVTADTWRSGDAVYGPTALAILRGANAVLVIPPKPLAHGEHRVRLLQNGRDDVSWSFSVDRPTTLSAALERTACGVPLPADVSLLACPLIPTELLVEETPATVTAGGSARVLGRLVQKLSGAALPRQELTLSVRTPGAVEWRDAGTAITDDDGRAAFDLADVSSFEYRLHSRATPAGDAAVSQVSLITAVRRFAGVDRYATAAALSRGSFPDAANDVFLVTGQNWPDALSAGPAAAVTKAPVLPVQGSTIPAAISEEITRLQPRRAWIIGGPEAVGDAVLQNLADRGIEVTRISGEDRYSTASSVAARFFASASGAYYASGVTYADALAGGAAAAEREWPLLLTAPEAVPVATALVGVERIALGGTAAISDAVVTALQARRVAGDDRFATAAAIALDAFPRAPVIHLATGLNFPDALAGTVAAARDGAPILLTLGDCVTPTTRDAAVTLGALDRVVLGGTAVVTDRAAGLTPC